jgi:death-on-curing protein
LRRTTPLSTATSYTFLAINGARFVADSDETYAFVAGLYQHNQVRFEKLVPWLRAHVEQEDRG